MESENYVKNTVDAMAVTPLISILMPVYNAEKYVQQAIQSILNQTHADWELLILNDGSTDNSKSLIREFSDARIKYAEQPNNLGYLRTCNSLFEKASGDFITFLDADDTCHPERLASCLSVFHSDSELGFITTDFNRVSENGQKSSICSSNIDYTRYSTDSSYAPTICCATIFIRSELLKIAGGYHPFFDDIGGEDYHWLFLLSRVGKGVHLNKAPYNYRTHSKQSHHLNQNPLKYYFAEINQELRWSIINGNIDLLEQDSEVKNRWIQRANANPSDLLFKHASSMLNRNEKIKAVITALKGLIKSPFSFTSWHRFLYLNYSALLR
jgi:glycosyltransferase involved in cell wall biosynthesis